MNHVPDWWSLVLLGLAVARVTRLVGWDDLTITPRRWVTGLGDEEHKQWAYVIDHQKEISLDPWRYPPRGPIHPSERRRWRWEALTKRLQSSTGSDSIPPIVRQAGDARPPISERRYYLSKLLRCPWCLGFWLGAAWWLAWLAVPHAMLIASTPLALSEVVGLVSKNLDP